MFKYNECHLIGLLVISTAVFAGIGVATTLHSIGLEEKHECAESGREFEAEGEVIRGECSYRIGENAWLNGIDYKEQKIRRKKR